jgi:hypothetical protein
VSRIVTSAQPFGRKAMLIWLPPLPAAPTVGSRGLVPRAITDVVPESPTYRIRADIARQPRVWRLPTE